jgi:hypothetical protein
MDLVGKRLLAGRELRDPRIPVQPCANVRVDMGTCHSEMSDLAAETICVGDHCHELVVGNHEVERTDVRRLPETSRCKAAMAEPPGLVRERLDRPLGSNFGPGTSAGNNQPTWLGRVASSTGTFHGTAPQEDPAEPPPQALTSSAR